MSAHEPLLRTSAASVVPSARSAADPARGGAEGGAGRPKRAEARCAASVAGGCDPTPSCTQQSKSPCRVMRECSGCRMRAKLGLDLAREGSTGACRWFIRAVSKVYKGYEAAL
eukprot:2285726-Pyramimonas_sp.AAC.1